MAILKQLEVDYEILDKLHDRGVEAIYEVRHRQLGELRMALVRSQRIAGGQQVQCLPAAHAVSRLGHPNVARVLDSSAGDDGIFVVIERITGLTLAELSAAGKSSLEGIPLPLTLEIARQALRAIGHLHQHHVVHRDVSPDNLMLTLDAHGRPLVKLIDFGIASDVKSDDSIPDPRQSAGAAGSSGARQRVIGKLRYAAPETFDDQEPGDARCDLYSFALVLYELLTGRFPIAGESASSLIAGHLFRPPLDFVESDPYGRVPEQIRHAVLKALAKSPSDRFADAELFAAALDTSGLAPLGTTSFELDLSNPEVRKLLELTRRAPRRSDPAGDTSELEAAPTQILRAAGVDQSSSATAPTEALRTIAPEPSAEAPTQILSPPALESPSDPAPGDPAPSESLKPSPGATTVLATAEQVEAEPPTERLDDHQVLRAMRSEAALAQGSTDGEESTTAIRGSATPGELPPDVDATAGREGLEETLRNIRALRDEGRAGEAFERLNRAVREYGPQPTLRSLRDELGEALLERDVEEEESASQIFEVESVPPPAAKSPRDRTPGAPSGASGQSLAEASIRGLSDATIRTFESPSQPVRDRPGPPTAHPTRNMVVAGLALVAIFAAAVYFISRQSPIDERQPLAVEDVTAADLSPGLLAVDAVPWAEIVALENPAVDDPPPISPSRFTPVILSLPPGEYRLTLRYPPSGQVEERLVQVDSDVRVEERIIFENLDAASYFERIGW